MDAKKAKSLARRVVRIVLIDILDRRGFRQEWDGCDQEIKEEIRKTLTTKVELEITRKDK